MKLIINVAKKTVPKRSYADTHASPTASAYACPLSHELRVWRGHMAKLTEMNSCHRRVTNIFGRSTHLPSYVKQQRNLMYRPTMSISHDGHGT